MNQIKGTTLLTYLEWYPNYDVFLKKSLECLNFFPCAFIIHDKDVYTYDDEKLGIKLGEPKKVHAHWVFNGKLSRKDFLCLETLLSVPTHLPHAQVVRDGKSMLNYLTHSDFSSVSKGKVCYTEADIHFSETFDSSSFKLISTQDYISEIYKLIYDNDISEISVLIDLIIGNGDTDLLEFCHNNIIRFKAYLDSKRYFKKV